MYQRIEFRSEARLDGNKLVGVAHAIGQRAWVKDHYEEFSADAFNEAINSPEETKAFWEHDRRLVLGSKQAGTLQVSVEERDGKPVLAYSVDLPDTSYANDLKALVARGDLNTNSFGFLPGTMVRSRTADGKQVITHTKVSQLVDVSPVSLPAFSGTELTLHSQQFEETVASQLIKARDRNRTKGMK